LTVKEAAARAKCGGKVIYRAVKNRKLKAARVDHRNTLRFLAEWIDDWFRSSVTIH
jgi:excisionase family DNA binding protein